MNVFIPTMNPFIMFENKRMPVQNKKLEKKDIEINTNIDIQAFESVDQIVSSQIVNIDSDQFDKNILLSIYNSL